MCSPSHPTWAPSRRSSVQGKRSAILVNCLGAQHVQVVWPLFTFCRQLRPGFKFSPPAHAGPKAAASGDEGVGLPGELVRVHHAVVLLPDPRLMAHGSNLFVHVPIIMCQVSHVMLRTQAVGMKSLQAAVRPADLAPIGFDC
jgi:hypothetical protein